MLNKRTWETIIYPSHGGTESIASSSMTRVITNERLLRKGLNVFPRWKEEVGNYKLQVLTFIKNHKHLKNSC